MQAIEIEVKIRVHDRAALEHNLLNEGFRLVTPSTYERNTLYDTPEHSLRARRQILRIRRYGDSWILTHKRIPEAASDQDPHKQRIETESKIEDGDAIGAIFQQLGFAPSFTYEKWRSEYADDHGHCVIDDTPIGLYAELEGPPEWIDRVLAKLHIDKADVTTLSYGRLFEQWKAATASPADNLTFDEIQPAGRG